MAGRLVTQGDAITSLRLDRATIGEFVRFTTIGFFGMFVDLGSLWVALNLAGANPYLARIFSFLVAATFTWACNRLYTFRDFGGGNLLAQWAKFLSVNAVGGLVNFAVYAAVLHQFGSVDWWDGRLQPFVPYAGVVAGAVVGLFVNFTASKRLIFR